MKEVDIERQMVCHMAFDTEHILKYEYTIITPDEFDNMRKFYSETITKKHKGQFGKFGKSETVWYFDNSKEVFKTGIELLNSIGLTPKTPK
jgi:hypothetical protein